MATVWASVAGAWTQDASSGWSHSITMRGFNDLVASLSAAKLNRRVTQLGIVAHGDAPGEVQLDYKLTPSNVGNFSAILSRLAGYLTSDGFMTFYSCIAGKGPEGTQLLTELSSQMRGRTIVAFEVYGYIGMGRNTPGNVQGTVAGMAEMVTAKDQLGRLTPWCPFAKRALNGQIVHYPVFEQNSRPNKKCAKPACPGHAEPRHFCQGW